MGAFDSALWLLAGATRELLLFAAVGLLAGGVDDLAIDLIYLARTGWRRLTVYRRHEAATADTLPRRPAQAASPCSSARGTKAP